LKPAKNAKIPVFVIFGYFQIAFSPVFLGVQTHVIPQKKGTVLYLKRPFADFSQFLSLAFKNCAASLEKCHFFQKKAKKYKIPNSVKIEKKLFRKKVLPQSSYDRINVQKIKQIGDVHWSLGRGRSLQKTAKRG
jgi:hypothetical protein